MCRGSASRIDVAGQHQNPLIYELVGRPCGADQHYVCTRSALRGTACFLLELVTSHTPSTNNCPTTDPQFLLALIFKKIVRLRRLLQYTHSLLDLSPRAIRIFFERSPYESPREIKTTCLGLARSTLAKQTACCKQTNTAQESHRHPKQKHEGGTDPPDERKPQIEHGNKLHQNLPWDM